MNSLKNLQGSLSKFVAFLFFSLRVLCETSAKGMEEIQSIKIPNFSVSQCDSLSGLYVQRENPSLKCLFCLYALIYISHCSWEEVAGKYLTLTAHGFI